jgi:hypothetical protein
MKVLKRNGKEENMSYDKITQRITKLTDGLNMNYIDPSVITQKVVNSIYDGITTQELDMLACDVAFSFTTKHYDYSKLAGRIAISNLHKTTPKTFSQCAKILYSNVDSRTGEPAPLLSEEVFEFINQHKNLIDSKIDTEKDFTYDYFGFKTLEKSYLLKSKGKIIERPQYMLMRVAIGISNFNIDEAFKIYDDLSDKFYTHATPTLFNAGTPRPQMSSCFLIANKGDSIEGLFGTMKDVAHISKWAGGIGLHVHDVRGKNAYIKGTGGESSGLIPMMKTYNEIARWINQCFVPETLVYCNNGIKLIKDIKEGDLVLSKDGEFVEVGDVYVYKEDSLMINIKTASSIDYTIVTNKHPFFVFKTLSNTYEWIDSSDIKIGDYIAKPIPKQNIESDLTKFDLYVIGLILSGGSYKNDVITLRLNNNSTQYLTSFFDNIGIKYICNENVISFTLNEQIESLMKLFNGEEVDYEQLYHLPIDKSRVLIHGIFDGIKSTKLNDVCEFRSEDKNLIGLIKTLCLHNKKGCVINNVDDKYVLTVENDYLFSLTNENITKTENWFILDNFILEKVVDITNNHYIGDVFDLKIKNDYDDASYTLLDGGIVHNGGKRKGSIAVYLEPWHCDIFDFIDLRKNHGKEEMRARDLFLALWIPNLFMEMVEKDGDWALFSPDEAPGLSDVYDSEDNKAFSDLYNKYINEGKARTIIKARDLMSSILDAQIETGTPYMLYKDHANNKSNQKNIGTIKSSNLCLIGDSNLNVKIGGEEKEISLLDVVEFHQNGEEIEVLSYDIENGVDEYEKVLGASRTSKNSEIIEILDEESGKKIICTPEHLVYTKNRGYVEAKDLLETDILQIK